MEKRIQLCTHSVFMTEMLDSNEEKDAILDILCRVASSMQSILENEEIAIKVLFLSPDRILVKWSE